MPSVEVFDYLLAILGTTSSTWSSASGLWHLWPLRLMLLN